MYTLRQMAEDWPTRSMNWVRYSTYTKVRKPIKTTQFRTVTITPATINADNPNNNRQRTPMSFLQNNWLLLIYCQRWAIECSLCGGYGAVVPIEWYVYKLYQFFDQTYLHTCLSSSMSAFDVVYQFWIPRI